MWAAYQSEIHAVECLVKNKADLTIKSSHDLTVIDYPILRGDYIMSFYLYLQKLEVKPAEFYQKEAKRRKRFNKIDYTKLLECLEQKIHPNEVPSFIIPKVYKKWNDPVIDPNEPWGKWVKRVANFGDPPMVERDTLDEWQQPQNRFFGKVHCWIHDMNPYPPPHVIKKK